jgi:hypothetical protein
MLGASFFPRKAKFWFILGLGFISCGVAWAGPPPGAVVSTVATHQACEARPRLYVRDHRTYLDLVRQILAAQHISPDHWWQHYQLDHVVSWGLCGADGVDNEWMQPIVQAKCKDGEERRLEYAVQRHDLGRPGGMILVDAQQYLAQGRWHQKCG